MHTNECNATIREFLHTILGCPNLEQTKLFYNTPPALNHLLWILLLFCKYLRWQLINLFGHPLGPSLFMYSSQIHKRITRIIWQFHYFYIKLVNFVLYSLYRHLCETIIDCLQFIPFWNVGKLSNGAFEVNLEANDEIWNRKMQD